MTKTHRSSAMVSMRPGIADRFTSSGKSLDSLPHAAPERSGDSCPRPARAAFPPARRDHTLQNSSVRHPQTSPMLTISPQAGCAASWRSTGGIEPEDLMATVTLFDLDGSLPGKTKRPPTPKGRAPPPCARRRRERDRELQRADPDTLGTIGGVADRLRRRRVHRRQQHPGRREHDRHLPGGTGGTDLVITFNSNATASRVQTLIGGLTVQDTSDEPTITHAITFNLAGTVRTDTLTVTPVNDFRWSISTARRAVTPAPPSPSRRRWSIAPAATLADHNSDTFASFTPTLMSRPDGNAVKWLWLTSEAARARSRRRMPA